MAGSSVFICSFLPFVEKKSRKAFLLFNLSRLPVFMLLNYSLDFLERPSDVEHRVSQMTVHQRTFCEKGWAVWLGGAGLRLHPPLGPHSLTTSHLPLPVSCQLFLLLVSCLLLLPSAFPGPDSQKPQPIPSPPFPSRRKCSCIFCQAAAEPKIWKRPDLKKPEENLNSSSTCDFISFFL